MRAVYFFIALVCAVALLPTGARAATLSVVASDSQVAIGSTIVVLVSVDSEGAAINNAEGVLVVPGDMFEVVSVSQNSSVFTLWIQQPATTGSGISFNGGLPSPGYTGSSGRIFSATLRAKAAGSGTFALSGAAVRANDGLGTDVLRFSGSAQVSVVQPSSAPQPQTPSESVPAAVSATKTVGIRSSTHPSEQAWYSNPRPVLELDVPAGADAIQTLVSKSRGTTPIVTYRPPITKKQLDALEDGVWYFNVRARTAQGWGAVSAYKLQIDTGAPTITDVSIAYDEGALDVSGTVSDSRSGVAQAQLLVDGVPVFDLDLATLETGTHASIPFRQHIPLSTSASLGAGFHQASVRVTDAAGNTSESEQFQFLTEASPYSFAGMRSVLASFDIGAFAAWALPISILSLLLNAWLWLKLRRQERRAKPQARGGDKFQREARQKLTTVKKDLQKQLRQLERADKRPDITPADASHIKKVRTHLQEAQEYIEQKIREVEKP